MQERRQNLQLREIFDEAYAQIACFFLPESTWGNQPHILLAHRQLQEDYPSLSLLERQTIIDAAYRNFQERLRQQAPSQ